MDIIVKQLKSITRMDQLIRLRATGSPEEFASRLGISKTKLYRFINIMKTFDAPIVYSASLQSFIYTRAVGFSFGFYEKPERSIRTEQVRGRC
ncbi:DNA-binding protein [Aquimarina longa]|uniref:DNA-binding protein n=1 Tax=Aquimarina longa TaxID=1080221 RepID=UPI000A3E09A1|nr:DNA-binding protein [Aquimarina longa]